MFLRCAFRAQADKHIVGIVQHKAFGQADFGYGQSVQAESAVTALAGKVGVQPFERFGPFFSAMAVFGTQGIFGLSAAVADRVNQMFGLEKGESSEDG